MSRSALRRGHRRCLPSFPTPIGTVLRRIEVRRVPFIGRLRGWYSHCVRKGELDSIMKRVINLWSLTGAVSVSLFVCTEIIAAAAVAVWAISGILALGTISTLALGVVVGIPSLYGIVKTCILAFEAETDPENN